MNNKAKIAGSLMSAALFGILCVGSTLALYQSKRDVKVHIHSADFHTTFYLEKFEYDYLDSQGLIKTNVEGIKDAAYASYLESKGVNLVDYTDYIVPGTKVVPTMEGKLTFALYNEGDVAFNYKLDYTISGDEVLKEQIKFTFDGIDESNPQNNLCLASSKKNFTVGYKFLDDKDQTFVNNDAKDKEVYIDVSITCIQVSK